MLSVALNTVIHISLQQVDIPYVCVMMKLFITEIVIQNSM